MNSIAFLKAAYIIAWLIYLGYLGRILLRMKAVERDREELERASASSGSQQVLTTEAQRH